MSEDLTKLVVALIFALLLVLAITQIGLAEKLDNMKAGFADALRVNDKLVYLLRQITETQGLTVDVIDLLADITGAKPEVK